jgi:hypothetical protein
MIIYIANKYFKKKFLKEFYPTISECRNNIQTFLKECNNKYSCRYLLEDLDKIEKKYFEVTENSIKAFPLFTFIFLFFTLLSLMLNLWIADLNDIATIIFLVYFQVCLCEPFVLFVTIVKYAILPYLTYYILMLIKYDYEFSDDLRGISDDLNVIKNRVIERIEDYGYQHILIAKEVKPYNILEYEYNLKEIIENNKKVKEELIEASKNDFIIYTALKTMSIIKDVNK